MARNLKQQTKSPTRKVLAYTGGSAVIGPALSEIVLYVLQLLNHGAALPDNIQKAVYTLIIVAAGFAAAYLTPAAIDDVPIVDPQATP